ncbi:flavin-containing monooxygenase [Phenylobacterium aquaticum]|uniref:flavin-containing monooxygenase n=1 Tax=Phenylobacterium aquaticum TaxID=1763816 RepID=UPI001F5C459E|nr:NAD(P)/FAD-dependent oxidoreductase [Phenylobacterium aquaticum]MCI3135007.1 NAD(P)/FAD-dependent oxidoreductase [Phenylobacterium aquaticum]
MTAVAAKGETTSLDAVIIGAGISGMYMLHRLRGLGLKARVYEAGSDVGGTWFWNRYPGARVDIESQEYSYSFSEELEREWKWSERYAAQPEILRYLNHVADRFDLRPDIQFDTRIASAHFDEAAGRWTVRTEAGETIDAKFCIAATGCLSVPNEPNFKGQETFKGPTYHTGRWPHEGVDFTGKRVAVIGTGSSAIQSIPQIAKQASQVYVFQRTPNYSVPAHNAPIDTAVAQAWLANRDENRQLQKMSTAGFLFSNPREEMATQVGDNERRKVFEERWAQGGFAVGASFADLAVDPAANAMIAEFAAEKIREIVKDPKVAEKLTPKDYPFGTKRLCVDTGYYEVFNRDNVQLIDLKETPLDTITPTGVKTTGAEFEVDAIVFAIGFDAMTGALSKIDIQGRGGQTLNQAWAEGPKSYLGIMVAGFPNFFTITGPGSPSVLSNMIVSIEQHVDWLHDLLAFMGQYGLATIEASPESQTAWVEHVNEAASKTLYPYANSWYLGANVPGKPRVFMPYIGGVGAYRTLCDAVAANGYMGFKLRPAA